MSQQFNGEVEQVAGNDIINKNNIINIHFPTATTSSQQELVSRAVRVLLRTCGEANCKTEVQNISQALFGSSFFKGLNLEQLAKLQMIAEALQSQVLKKGESHTAFTQEMDEYDDFLRRTGVRASKLERAALTELMTTHPINPKQIKLAWSNSILVYEDNRLRIKLPTLEPWIGGALALVSIGGLYLFVVQVILVKLPVQQLIQQVPTILMFVTALILSVRTMIAPAFIGKRIKAAIEKA